jgi:signal transduction histidine kinase
MTSTATDLRRWMRELRSLVVTITPPQLHVQGLAPSLADLAATLEVRGLAVSVDVTGTEQVDETTETLVYRAAQEAIRNIVRHADASTVTLSVARARASSSREESLILRVRDDGRGFETSDTAARTRGSVGLELLSALVSSHGGTLTVDTSPGQGTELVMKVPVEPSNEPPTQVVAREPADTRAPL